MSETSDVSLGVGFFLNGLCSLCHIAKNELMNFEDFHAETEESWQTINKNLESKIDRIIERHPAEREEIIEHFSLDLHEKQEKFPSIHRRSLVITIYSFLENTLNELCNTLSESVDSNVVLTDLKGRGMERALSYLSKVAEFDLSKMGGTLSYIKNINRVRNFIVHNGGVLPSEPEQKVNIFIASTENIFGNPGGNIRFESTFISEMIEVFIRFLNELDIEVQKHIQASIAL
jgi:hypothetical protein